MRSENKLLCHIHAYINIIYYFQALLGFITVILIRKNFVVSEQKPL